MEHPNSRLDLVSDASVHVKDRKVAGAWHLLGKDVKRRCMVRTLKHQRHSHSYRHELETYFHALADADAILKLPHRITKRMDCKGGLDKMEAPIYTPKDTMGSDTIWTL